MLDGVLERDGERMPVSEPVLVAGGGLLFTKERAGRVAVLSGLKGGETIVTNPPTTLQSGDRYSRDDPRTARLQEWDCRRLVGVRVGAGSAHLGHEPKE